MALRDVSITVPEKSIYGLLGPNGAGKTTLIRIITQIIRADEGQIYFDGHRLTPEDAHQIGYLPEERGLYKKMKVFEELRYLARLKGVSKQDDTLKIRTWLQKLDLLEWQNKNVQDLSKGMQQKVQFIATILHDPKIVILDEPFSGFDPINTNLIRDEILELRERGATIIFSTHRMETVEELCDHICLINQSKKILEGSKRDIKNAHKQNIFIVEHKGALDQLNGHFTLLDHKQLEDDFYLSQIKIAEHLPVKELLSSLIERVEVKSFNELIPNMNEIFINQIANQSHG